MSHVHHWNNTGYNFTTVSGNPEPGPEERLEAARTFRAILNGMSDAQLASILEPVGPSAETAQGKEGTVAGPEEAL